MNELKQPSPFDIPAQVSTGRSRAEARLAAKRRQANGGIPTSVVEHSRQVLRAQKRRATSDARKHQNEVVLKRNVSTLRHVLPGNRAMRRKLMSQRCPTPMRDEAMAGIKKGMQEAMSSGNV